MKTAKFLLSLLMLTGVLFAPAALCADKTAAQEKRLVGIWQEYEPGENVVQFFPDHTMRIYLTEEEGKEGGSHWIEANWSITPDGVLKLEISTNGESFSQTTQLRFEKDELWLEGEDAPTTKQRRIGAVPAKYKW